MNFNVFGRYGSQENCSQESNKSSKKTSLWHRRSLRGNRDRQRQNATLPRVCKPNQPTALVDYSDPQRTMIVLEKQDNESYGFDIQVYKLPLRSSTAVDVCTLVCSVREDSIAESAGLTAGDIIVTVNSVSIEGLSHQHVLDLMRESTNSLKIETVSGNIVKQFELEKKLNQLKQSLREKLLELQTLGLQEKRLLRGKTSDGLHSSVESDLSSPAGHWGRRFSSDSSYRSAMTDDSDQVSVFGDVCSPSPHSAATTEDDGCFFPSKDFSSQAQKYRSSNAFSSSSSLAGSSSSLSPMWDETKASSIFGTLPRRGRRASVRKHIFKLIPGLQSSVEEEDTPR